MMGYEKQFWEGGYTSECQDCDAMEKRLRRQAKEIDRLTEQAGMAKFKVAEQADRIKELEKIIEEAPHDDECTSVDWPDVDGKFPCNCWKSRV